MWETSRFRGGNGGNRSGNSGGKRKGKATLRMKRVQAQIVINHGWGMPATLVGGRLVLNDLGPKSVTLFSSDAIALEQMVTFSIEHPRSLVVRGKVTYCALFDVSKRIHGTGKTPYRLQVEFDFLNDGEAEAVREFVDELRRNELSKAAA